MKSVFPKDFDELAHQMATNDTIYEKFFRYTYNAIEFYFVLTSSSNSRVLIFNKFNFCLRYFNSDSWGHNFGKREVVCKMVSSVFIDERKCNEIMGE